MSDAEVVTVLVSYASGLFMGWVLFVWAKE
jgi:hypothetical protein